jgi:hypothetical protein
MVDARALRQLGSILGGSAVVVCLIAALTVSASIDKSMTASNSRPQISAVR